MAPETPQTKTEYPVSVLIRTVQDRGRGAEAAAGCEDEPCNRRPQSKDLM